MRFWFLYRSALLLSLFCIFSAAPGKAVSTTPPDTTNTLLWKISGNGLNKPSHLFGTMHVSNKIAFHLGDKFFEALQESDRVALETNPGFWASNLFNSNFFQKAILPMLNERLNAFSNFYEEGLKTKLPDDELYGKILSSDQSLINKFLYRRTMQGRGYEFEEETYLDLFIFQSGKKMGKKINSLETFKQVMELRKQATIKGRKEKNSSFNRSALPEGKSFQDLLKDAYREQNINKLDSLSQLVYPKYYTELMINKRNHIMAGNLDSLMQTSGSVFAGIGAAHLPGKEGVINILREKGYEVTPVISTPTEQSKALKDTLMKQAFDVEYQTEYASDSSFKVKMPGSMFSLPLSKRFKQYFSPDMVNGTFYVITKINHYGPLKNQTPEKILTSISNLLYENIPGDILQKDTIEKNGWPALDILNKTKKGDVQRYQIIVTPLQTFVLKMGGTDNYVRSGASDIYFDSFSLDLPHNQKKTTYHAKNNAFEVKLPGMVVTEQSPSFLPMTKNHHIQALDTTNGNYYLVKSTAYPDFSYIEEDRFELEQFAYYLEKDLEGYTIDKRKFSDHNQYPAYQLRLTNKKDDSLFARFIKKGPRYYLLAARSKTFPGNFFNSFRFRNYTYKDPFFTHRDTALMYTVQTPVHPSTQQGYISGYGWFGNNYNNDKPPYKSDSKHQYLMHPETAEKVKISYYKFHRFDPIEDTTYDRFWEWQKNHITKNNSMAVKEFTQENDSVGLFILSDTNSSRTIGHKIYMSNNFYHDVIFCSDTVSAIPSFTDSILSTFHPLDTNLGTPLLINKTNLFLKTLEQDNDSLNQAAALNSMYWLDFTSEQAPRLIQLIKNFNFDQHKGSYKADLIKELGEIEHKSIVPFLKKLYTREASHLTELAILEALAEQETKKSYKAVLKLLKKKVPLTTSKDKVAPVFHELNDSLQLAQILYPELLNYTRYREYQDEIYELLAGVRDSTRFPGKKYKRERRFLLREAKNTLQRQLATEEEEKEENSYYSSGTSQEEARLEDRLVHFVAILEPFQDKAFYDKVMNVTKPELKMRLALKHLEYGLPVEDSLWEHFASRMELRLPLYKRLKALDHPEKFPEKYVTQKAMATAVLYEGYSDPAEDSIQFLDKKLVNIKGKEGYVYFFKRKGYSDNYVLDFTALQPKDTSGFNINPGIVEKYHETINPREKLDKLLDEKVHTVQLYGRERAGVD